MTVDVVLTPACNLSCAYCYQNRKQARRMDWDTLRAAIDLLLQSRQGDVTLNFCGGEPLLEFPLLRRAVEYAGSARPAGTRIDFGVSTNGTRLTEEIAAFLGAHRIDTQLSFDGIRPAQDQRGKGTFPVVDALLDRLRRRNPVFFQQKLEIAITLTGANLPWLADSVDYFLARRVRRMGIAPRMTHDIEWPADLVGELDRQFSRVYRSCLRHYRRTGTIPLQLFQRSRGPSRPAQDRSMCDATNGGTIVVDVDGSVSGCVTLARSYQQFPSSFLEARARALNVGHILDPGLEERLEDYRRVIRRDKIFLDKADKYSSYGRCGDCRFLEDCFVCPVSIGHIPGNTDPRRISDVQCAFNRVTLDHRARFPSQPTADDVLRGRAPVPVPEC